MRQLMRVAGVIAFGGLFILPLIALAPYLGPFGNSFKIIIDPVAYATDSGDGGTGVNPQILDSYSISEASLNSNRALELYNSKKASTAAAGDGTENLNYQDYMKNVFDDFKTQTQAELSKDLNRDEKTLTRQVGYKRDQALDLEDGD